MPIFNVKCVECANEDEVLCKYEELGSQACSECGGEVEKLVSTTNFALKGKDWPGRNIRRENEFKKNTRRD